MRVAFFAVPAIGGSDEADALNSFLAGHRVRDLERRFVEAGSESYWAIAVVTVDAASRPPAGAGAGGMKPRIDYREVLSPDEFGRFARLRTWRKDAAAKEGVPIYQVVTNEQLAEIVRAGMRTKAELATVTGFGPARLGKYGDSLVAAIAAADGAPPNEG